MALVKCRECNKEVSSQASHCVGCGYKGVSSDYKKAQDAIILNNPIFKVVSFVSTVLVLGGIVTCMMNSTREASKQTAHLSECTKKGVLYFAEISSYPTLSDGRDAIKVAEERCNNSSSAFDGLKTK